MENVSSADLSELDAKIKKQLEYYFGDFNLPRDRFLQERIQEDEGWVTLETLLTFKRLKALVAQAVVEVVKKSASQLLEVSADGTKIRRNPEKPAPEATMEYQQQLDKQTVYVKGFPPTSTLDELEVFFAQFGQCINIFMRRLPVTRIFEGLVFATFATEEEAAAFLAKDKVKFNELELVRKRKTSYVARTRGEREARQQEEATNQEAGAAEERERAPSIDKDDRNSAAINSSGLPATDRMDIFVACVISVDNVFFRLAKYECVYQDLLSAMDVHYGCGDKARVVGDLMDGHLYATLYDDAWRRVQLVARQGNGKAKCYFVDEGYTVLLDEAALVHLEHRFAAVPMQAIHCQLDGLVQYAQCDGITDILSEVLVGKRLEAEVTRMGAPTTVVVYDMGGPDDWDLNREIFWMLMWAGLPEKGLVGKTLLGHVGTDGVVWLQPNPAGMQEMHDFEEALENYCQTNPAMEEEPVMDTLYACLRWQDGRFYRAVLTSPNRRPSGEFEELFVDFGVESRAVLGEFRNIDCLGHPVVSLPPQAVKCRLQGLTGADGITWSETATAKLLSLAGKGTELLVRVVEPASCEEPALVKLFKRHEQSRDLVSINDTLAESLQSTPAPTALFGQRR